MADGIFTIKPKYLSDITCTLGESASVKYYVIQSRINWNEQDRVKIAYASGGHGGFASGEQHGLAQASFEMIIFGDDLADAMGGLRTVTQALISGFGGYIQYRPRGLSSGVMSTYYHYLPSPPPAIQGQSQVSDLAPNYVQPGRSHTYAIRCQCQVMIKAWATSNPESLATIYSRTLRYNMDDSGAAKQNWAKIESTDIKGDCIFPRILVEGGSYGGLATYNRKVFVHKRRMIYNVDSNRDWVEAEDCDTQTNFTNQVVANISGGECERTTSDTAVLIRRMDDVGMGWDSSYFGNIVCLVAMRVYNDATYSVKFSVIDRSTGDTLAETETKDVGAYVSVDNYRLVWLDTEVPIPPGPILEQYDDNTTPTIGALQTDGLDLRLDFARVSGASPQLDVDFFIAAKSDDFIGYFTDQNGSHGMHQSIMEIDSYFENAWIYSVSSVVDAYCVCNGQGFRNLRLDAGFDYRLRFMVFDHSSYEDRYIANDDFYITINGMYGTIFPFEVA